MTITQLILRGNVNKRHVTRLGSLTVARAENIQSRQRVCCNANVSTSQFRRRNCQSVLPERTPERNYLCINPNIQPFDYMVSSTRTFVAWLSKISFDFNSAIASCQIWLVYKVYLLLLAYITIYQITRVLVFMK